MPVSLVKLLFEKNDDKMIRCLPLVIIVNVNDLYLIGVNNRELGTVVSMAEPGSLPPSDRNQEESEQSYEPLERHDHRLQEHCPKKALSFVWR